jgi:hypothetical protein
MKRIIYVVSILLLTSCGTQKVITHSDVSEQITAVDSVRETRENTNFRSDSTARSSKEDAFQIEFYEPETNDLVAPPDEKPKIKINPDGSVEITGNIKSVSGRTKSEETHRRTSETSLSKSDSTGISHAETKKHTQTSTQVESLSVWKDLKGFVIVACVLVGLCIAGVLVHRFAKKQDT